MTDNTEEKILEYFKGLKNLDKHLKKLIHYKSISNIIYHLIEKNIPNSKSTQKLKELGDVRAKDLLLEYLTFVESNKPTDTNDSLDLYNKYIDPIGGLMMKYHKFSNFAGKSLIIYYYLVGFLIVLICLFNIYWKSDYANYIILLVFLLSSARIGIKFYQKRIYGFLY